MYLGHRYSLRVSPEFRLASRAIWPTLAFAIQSLLFLLVGLDMRSILESISSLSPSSVLVYSLWVTLTVVIGRFIWVYPAVYIPRWLFPHIRKKEPRPPWQYPIIVSWAGMRGGISLAAALAVPALPVLPHATNPKDLLIFLVFCVITATLLLQGLTLPWLLKIVGMKKYGQSEQYNEHLAELATRSAMVKSAIHRLNEIKEEVKDNPKLLKAVKLYLKEYRMIRAQLKEKRASHDSKLILTHDEKTEWQDELFILSQLIEIQREELLQLWHNDKINLAVRNKLLEQLDHLAKHLPE